MTSWRPLQNEKQAAATEAASFSSCDGLKKADYGMGTIYGLAILSRMAA